MVTCTTCGNQEQQGSRFCGNCGAPFAPEDRPLAHAAMSSGTMLTCATCGNEEPEGSRFCGNCGAPFVPTDQPRAPAAAPETPSPEPAVQQPSPVEPRSTPPRSGRRPLRWVAAGAAVALLVAGGATVALLSLTGGGGSTEAAATEQQTLPPAAESPPPASNPALVDSVAPRLEELATSQGALSAQVRSLTAGVRSFAALHDAAESLAVTVMQTQESLAGLTPNDNGEASTLLLLRRALAAHLAYAKAVSGFPLLPRSLTSVQAHAAIARAEQAQLAYASLAFADPALPSFYISSSDHARLLAVVPSPKPALLIATRRMVDFVPLLVGIGPDDPPGQGRCFGPYSSRASLGVSGVVHRSGFIQCGDDARGDPSRASGVYRFAGPTFSGESRLVRMTGLVAIDESSAQSQRGSSVTWTVFYDGTPVCSKTVAWSGVRPVPRRLDCKIPSAASSGGLDVRRLRIQQVASLASQGSLWAGVLNPMIVVEPV